jgi:hypothetical protein
MLAGLTTLLQDTLLANRAFSVVATHHSLTDYMLSRSQFSQLAKQKGFDHILYVTVSQLTPAAGISNGKIALSFKLVNLKQNITVWKIYGEQTLVPRPSSDMVLLRLSHLPAPSVSAGFSNIIKQISKQYLNKS